MVTRGTVDWEQHKKDVYIEVLKRAGEDKAKKFIDFYAARYDKYGRNLIDWKLAYWLMNDYYYVKNIGTRWYACVGMGGTGKSTLMKNIFYFFDDTLKPDRVQLGTLGFLKNLKKFSVNNSMKAMFMDEPDDSINTSSQSGKALREVLGKMRQQNLFLGICATDLKDIPIYIFRKLDGIIFLPNLGNYMFFRNRPIKKDYPLQSIRRDYGIMGYKVFWSLSQSKGCMKGRTYNVNPFTAEEEEQYRKVKGEDYFGSVDKAIGLISPKTKPNKAEKEDPRKEIAENLITKFEMPKHKIAEVMDVDRKTLYNILNRGTGKGNGEIGD